MTELEQLKLERRVVSVTVTVVTIEKCVTTFPSLLYKYLIYRYICI